MIDIYAMRSKTRMAILLQNTTEIGLPKRDHISQLTTNFESPIRRSICGIASLTMALRAAGFDVDLKQVFAQVLEFSDASAPTVYWRTAGLEVPVTYDRTGGKMSSDELIHAAKLEIDKLGGAEAPELIIDSRPIPGNGGFNIMNGFDYRVIERVLGQYYDGLTVDQSHVSGAEAHLDNTSIFFRALGQVDLDSNLDTSSMLVSVYSPVFARPWDKESSRSRHVVYIDRIEFICSTAYVHYSDPSIYTEVEGSTICPMSHLAECFAGNLAVISKDTNFES